MSDSAAIYAPDAVQALALGLFPDSVALAVTFPWDSSEGLLPKETASLGQPNDKRLSEFAAGRRAARQAMADLGHPTAAVPHGADRAPQWPRTLVGSISHNDSICMAVLAHATRFASLGLDIEEDADLPDDLLPEICTRMELAWLSVQPQDMRGRLARLIFSAKECAYKLQYPLTGQMLGFDSFEITPDTQTGQFEATLTRSVDPFEERTQFSGHFAFGAGLVITGMTMSHPATT